MHYSTPDGWHKAKRMEQIRHDNWLCFICPIHRGENTRGTYRRHGTRKSKEGK